VEVIKVAITGAEVIKVAITGAMWV
jgi:hypothetical protein